MYYVGILILLLIYYFFAMELEFTIIKVIMVGGILGFAAFVMNSISDNGTDMELKMDKITGKRDVYMKKILVVGSLNMDTVLELSHLPQTGETISGQSLIQNPGGKGANQAYTIGKLGGNVVMIGAVGVDAAGNELLENLKSINVDVSGIRQIAGVPTGQAFIAVDNDGNNSIIIIAGSNGMVTKTIIDENIDMVMCAAGGDLCYEMLPYINTENILKNPKWIMGASDPTSVLYYVTTKLDIATMYGHNAGGYDAKNLDKSNIISLDYLKGNFVKQDSYPFYESDKKSRTVEGYKLDTDVVYENLYGDVDVEGRIIGGCVDVLKDVIGTKFDGTKEFLKRYSNDGIVWYFDIFALTSEDFYKTMLQFREAGWFDNTKAILVGRVMYPNSYIDLSYQEALTKAFDGLNIPVVFNMDIGHVVPKMTIINGAICHVISKDGKGSLEFSLR